MDRKEHWEDVYSSKPPERLGWYEPQLETSLSWVRELGLDMDASIIDVGGGASTLIDNLLDDGYRSVTILAISNTALALSQARLGEKAAPVSWLVGDITQVELPARRFDLWHDRAVLHFLTDPSDRKGYRRALEEGVVSGGHVIIATFGLEGPTRCSGLEVRRYSPAMLSAELGDAFELREARGEDHLTPTGVVQPFVFCLFRRHG